MADKIVSVKIDVSTEESESNVRALSEAIGGVTPTLSGVKAATKGAFGATPEMAATIAQIKQTTTEMEVHSSKVESLRACYTSLQDAAGAAFMAGDDAKYSELTADVAAYEKELSRAEAELRRISAAIDESKAKLGEQEGALSASTEQAKSSGSVWVKLLGGQEKYNSVMAAMPAPLRAAATATGGLTKASLAFIATPLGAVIALVVLGLKALQTYFTGSAEGQMELAKITGYLSGVLGQLKEILITVGKRLMSAFSDPKQAIADLWEFIKTNLMNRLHGVADGFKAIASIIGAAFTGDWEGVKKGAGDYANALLKVSTGVDNLIGKTQNYVATIGDVAKKTSELKVQEEQLARDRKKWSIQEAELERKANEAFEKYQKGGTDAVRKKALAEYEVAVNQKYDKLIEFQKQELAIKEALAKLTTNDQQTNDDIIAAKAELEKLEGERVAARSRASRGLGSLGRKEGNGVQREQESKEDSYDKVRKKQQESLNDELLTLDKKRAKDKDELRKLEVAAVLRSIGEEKAAYLAMASEKGITVDPENDPILKLFFARVKAVNDTEKVEQADKLAAALEQFATYQQRREAIQKEYNDKIALMSEGEGKVANADNISLAEDKKKEELDALDDTLFSKNTADFEAFANEMVDKSITDLAGMLSALKESLAAGVDSLGAEPTAVLNAKIRLLEGEIKALKKKGSTGKDGLKDWQATQKVLGGVVKTTTDVINGFEGISDEVKEGFTTVLMLASNITSVIDSIKTFSEASNKAILTSAETTKKGVSAVEKASVILAIISAAMQVAMAIANIITGADEAQKKALAEIDKSITDQEKRYEKIRRARALLYEKGTTIFGGDDYGKAKNAVKIYGDELDNLHKKMSTPWDENLTLADKANTLMKGKKIDTRALRSDIEKQLAGLGDVQIVTGFEKTGLFGWGKGRDTFSGILSVYPDLINSQGEFNTELAKTIVDTREFSEGGKEALQGMIEASEQAEKAMEVMTEYLTGLFGELGTAMKDTMVDAFRNGREAGREFFDDIGGMLEKMASDIVYSMTLAPLFEQAQKDILAVEKDTRLSDDEKFKKTSQIMGKLAKDATAQEDKINTSLELFKKEAEKEGIDIYKKGGQEQNASAKGMESMSQETAGELNGRFTDLQVTGRRQLDNSIAHLEYARQTAACSIEVVGEVNKMRVELSEITDIGYFSLRRLEGIEKNTFQLYDIAEQLKKIELHTSKL